MQTTGAEEGHLLPFGGRVRPPRVASRDGLLAAYDGHAASGADLLRRSCGGRRVLLPAGSSPCLLAARRGAGAAGAGRCPPDAPADELLRCPQLLPPVKSLPSRHLQVCG